jgi:hypothetical protein
MTERRITRRNALQIGAAVTTLPLVYIRFYYNNGIGNLVRQMR